MKFMFVSLCDDMDVCRRLFHICVITVKSSSADLMATARVSYGSDQSNHTDFIIKLHVHADEKCYLYFNLSCSQNCGMLDPKYAFDGDALPQWALLRVS